MLSGGLADRVSRRVSFAFPFALECCRSVGRLKKTLVLYSIRLSPEVYAGTLTLSRLGVLSKKF